MAENSRTKVKELLGRHSELEQSETKAQAALVTILSLTQITELKLLLDIGRQGHRFYDFVLTLLVSCVSLEIFIGVIIIYIGNLHYYQGTERVAWCYNVAKCCRCLGHACRVLGKRSGAYESVHEPPGTGAPPTPHAQRSPVGDGISTATRALVGGGGWTMDSRLEAVVDFERAGGHMELSRVKVADAEVKIIRANNYVKVVEEALKKAPGNSDLEEELGRAREELGVSLREKEEGEAEQKLYEVQQHHTYIVKENHEDQQERMTFRKISFWQHMATYLLYFVMLMNVFITTFGISGGSHYVFTNHVTTTTAATVAMNTRLEASTFTSAIASQPMPSSTVFENSTHASSRMS